MEIHFPARLACRSEVFMAPGKTYDVTINVPAAGGTALPIFDRQGSLSGNGTERDAGMLAYISVNGAGTPAVPSPAAVAVADTYNSVIAGQTLTVSDPVERCNRQRYERLRSYSLQLPTGGTLTLASNGTFTYVPNSGTTSDSFQYCATNSTTACAQVTFGAATIEAAAGITVNADAYTSNLSTSVSVKSPGVLMNDADGTGYPLTVNGATPTTPLTIALTGGGSVSIGPDGGFSATVPAPGTYTFTYKARNSQGTVSRASCDRDSDLPGRKRHHGHAGRWQNEGSSRSAGLSLDH